jgi:hypothetical protein
MGRATREVLRPGWWPRLWWGRDAVQTRPGGADGGDPGRVGIVSVESDRGGGAGLVLGGGGARGAYASGALSGTEPDQRKRRSCSAPPTALQAVAFESTNSTY